MISNFSHNVGRHLQPGSQTVLPSHEVPFLSTAHCIILPNHLTTTQPGTKWIVVDSMKTVPKVSSRMTVPQPTASLETV